MSQATQQKPLRIYVGSCPDYSHQHGFYTHDKVGDGVPLLTTVHLKHELELLTVLSKAEIPHEYVIMIADTEAIDEVFCKRFANGREDEFLKRCERSRQKTSEVLREARESGF
ncbi:hypothetical protein KKB40_02890, partial [Patescibacteria group bacterium]|nr:hypothetical protein [Patescibacteria group bacterium]